MIRHPPRSTLFPYPPLFRSGVWITAPRSARQDAGSTFHRLAAAAMSIVRAVAPARRIGSYRPFTRTEKHTSELQSRSEIACRLLLLKKKKIWILNHFHSAHH